MQHWFSLPPRVALLGVVLASNTATLRAQQEALGPMVELSIDEALSRALRDSEEVKLARAAVELAAAEVTIARSAAFPQVNTSLAYVRTFQSAFSSGFQLPHFPRFAPNPSAPLESRVRYLEQNAQTAAFSVIQDLVDGQALSLPFGRAHTYSTGLTASQLLFAGGRVKAGIEIAQHSYAAADYALAEEIAEIQLQVRAVYYQALFAQEVETIAQAALVQAASFLNQERLRLQAGYASDLDVLRAEVSLANIRPQLVEARNATSLALLNLKRIVNVPLQQPVRLTTPLEAPTAAELTRTGLAPRSYRRNARR
ncbi:MAG TPA: TolC family protein [Bryobacteraceae bacterium]|nr:TolC family protein [Bryobacteraceae bacterium]